MDVMEALRRVEEVSQVWDRHLHSNRSQDSLTAVCKAVDGLLVCLLCEPVKTEDGSIDSVKRVLDSTRPNQPAPLAEQIKVVDQDLIPVLVMREVMRRRGIDFDPKQVPHWSEFVRRYGNKIILASE